jgi:hypothetical protein
MQNFAEGRATARTIGVPTRFACPVLCSEEERIEMSKYQLIDHVTVKTIDVIALLVRQFATLSVYNVNGGLDSAGNLISTAPAWQITPAHRLRLLAIVARANSIDPKLSDGSNLATYANVLSMEQSMHVKRARGNTVVNGRCLVYYECTYDSMMAQGYGHELGIWLDITQNTASHPLATNNMWQSTLIRSQRLANTEVIMEQLDSAGRLPRNCESCHKQDAHGRRHLLCNQCKQVSYCSRVCQKAHWKKSHKALCCLNK